MKLLIDPFFLAHPLILSKRVGKSRLYQSAFGLVQSTFYFPSFPFYSLWVTGLSPPG
jgi:hypothetical protein